MINKNASRSYREYNLEEREQDISFGLIASHCSDKPQDIEEDVDDVKV